MDKYIRQLSSYGDERGNKIIFNGLMIDRNINIMFRGSNNTLIVHKDAKPSRLEVRFGSDNGLCHIGKTHGSIGALLGMDSKIVLGDGLTTTGQVYITAAEGSEVKMGDDCMLAVGVQIRSDDGHPIFDVRSGRRINPPKDILVGSHVWLGYEAAILSGACIGSGSVIGFRSLVKGFIPNNCVAVGVPARVVRKHIAWERPHLALNAPGYKPDISNIRQTKRYWLPTKIPRDLRPWWWRTLAKIPLLRKTVKWLRSQTRRHKSKPI